ncbi:hypothetical protein [Phascolarctobacterium succinatutens]|uniref:hypothetical protein n=1 Tax=Phascolarctobacterium succinatutens TaxID=626940 RepID=UPI0026E969AC|nr:hypothetical protein [Phascolarctobacterium succinatutens]
MAQTNEALQNNKLTNLTLGSSAAAAILLPQAVTKAAPQLFTKLAPFTAQTLPYCTGVCGSCGGSCLGSLTVIAFLAMLAKINSKHKEEQP